MLGSQYYCRLHILHAILISYVSLFFQVKILQTVDQTRPILHDWYLLHPMDRMVQHSKEDRLSLVIRYLKDHHAILISQESKEDLVILVIKHPKKNRVFRVLQRKVLRSLNDIRRRPMSSAPKMFSKYQETVLHTLTLSSAHHALTRTQVLVCSINQHLNYLIYELLPRVNC